MLVDHAKWLQQQGVRIIDQHTLHLASTPRFRHEVFIDGNIANTIFETTTEQVYTVELDEHIIERLERMEADIHHAIDYANRKYTSRGAVGYTGGPSDVTQFFIDNKERHLELLQENSMYRDAWKEFQSIRVLLGETPHWP